MHFSIISLEDPSVDKADFLRELPFEDPTIEAFTDYYGDRYNASKREDVIKSWWLPKLFEGIATIDTENETITFLDEDTIRMTLKDYLRECVEKINERFEDGKLDFFEFREIGRHYKGADTMFYLDDHAETSADFMEDAIYRAGKSYKIGHIFDAHW